MKKEINKFNNFPNLATKFANVVFLLGILYSILLIVYAIHKIYITPEVVSSVLIIFIILCGGVFATLFSLGLTKLSNKLKVNLSIMFFTICITVYGFETYLEFSKKTSIREIIAKLMDVSYDLRTKMEVLDDLRDSGIEIYPKINPRFFIKSDGLKINNGRIYPLGTIANSTTIFNNELGYYPIIETDEHGFNNPKGLYKENKVDILLTGDSFTEGYSVHSNKNISAVLRRLNLNTINLGKADNGPLLELAALKEYAEPLKPKIVLWVYFINDLSDLSQEMTSSILNKYLYEEDYSQNLIFRQEEIDVLLIDYIKDKMKNEKIKIVDLDRKLFRNKIINLLKLTELRGMINLTFEKPVIYEEPASTSIFRDILQKSKQMVLDWGGKMYFVYLPTFERYSTGNEHKDRDIVMQIVNELDIPIIDIHYKVFAPHPDPLSLFPFRMNFHYTADGYRLVAEAISKRLKDDGLIPLESDF